MEQNRVIINDLGKRTPLAEDTQTILRILEKIVDGMYSPVQHIVHDGFSMNKEAIDGLLKRDE